MWLVNNKTDYMQCFRYDVTIVKGLQAKEAIRNIVNSVSRVACTLSRFQKETLERCTVKEVTAIPKFIIIFLVLNNLTSRD